MGPESRLKRELICTYSFFSIPHEFSSICFFSPLDNLAFVLFNYLVIILAFMLAILMKNGTTQAGFILHSG